MPEAVKTELDIELEKRTAAQKEYDDAIDEIMDKTDEEIREIERTRKKESDGTGESTKDQTTVTDPVKPVPDTPVTPEPKPMEPTVPAPVETPAVVPAEIEQLKSELQKEKQKTSSWDGRIRAANDKVKSLEATITSLTEQLQTKVATEDNEQEKTDQEVMETFKKTFPELVDVIGILEKKIKVTTPPAAAKGEPKPEVRPDTTTQEPKPEVSTAASDEHYRVTRKAHPDLDEAVSSGVLLTWINTQPELTRPYLEDVYYGRNGNGSSEQIVAMATEFKEKSGWKSQINTGDSAKNTKLASMLESEGDSSGAKTTGPDKNDFDGAAEEAFKE